MTENKNRPTAKELLPLIFDEPDKTPQESLEDWHKIASAEIANFKWPNKN